MSEHYEVKSEEGSANLLDRVKAAVGMTPSGPKAHKLGDFEEPHEADTSPHASLRTERPTKPLTSQPGEVRGVEASSNKAELGSSAGDTTEDSSTRVAVTKLLKPQEVEVGMEKPELGLSREMQSGDIDRSGGNKPRTAATTGPTAPATPGATMESIPSRVTADLESRGFRRVEGGLTGTTSTSVERTSGRQKELPEPVQEVYVRPPYEAGAVSAANVAKIKAREHALLAEESQRRAAAKHAELMALRQQAAALEEQSAALLEEAEAERRRVDEAMQKKEDFEHLEWRGYVEAEKAETDRRAAVELAKPAARSAESLEREALIMRQNASDWEFHAQVLENRARALLRESEEMAATSLAKAAEARNVAAQLTIVRQETDELRLQIDTHAARGLPAYIGQCQREIGALLHRVAQLREEISWAESEIEQARDEKETWQRIVVSKEAAAARLLLEMNELQADASEARERSRHAAEEAREPTELAEHKYKEAWEASQKASELEEEAKAAQSEALEAVKAAFGPEQERQRALREAAAAEAVAKTIETRAEVVAGKATRHTHEAEVKAETAVTTTERAERKEKAFEREKDIGEAESKMARELHLHEQTHQPMEVPAV